MHTLTITHTAADGTLIDGTSRGDGSAEILKTHRWRWGRSIGCWYIPRSRDQFPKTHVIDATAAALREAGFAVEIDLDTSPRSTAEAELERRTRASARAEHLAAKSDRLTVQAEQLHTQAREAADRIPFGQPILIGHHSEGRDRRYRARIATTQEKAFTTYTEAHRAGEAAARAARNAATDSAQTIARRIQRLETELRQWHRNHPHPQSARARSEITRLEDAIAYWVQQRQELVNAGAPDHSATTINVGDLVSITHGRWHRVTRCNKVTVSVDAGHSTFRIRYDQILAVKPQGTP